MASEPHIHTTQQGIAPAARVLHKTKGVHPLDVFERTLKVNAVGSFNIARLAAEVMAQNEVGE